jgi:hypothetical protein
MKKQILKLSALLFAVVLMIGVNSCKKDEDSTTAFALSSLKADAVDLNGAVSANNVAADATITATFAADVDASTANSTNIILLRDYDNTTLTATITASGKTITITPDENLASGAMHKLTIGAGIKSTSGDALGTAVIRTFYTDGFFAPTGMVAYWNFDTDANDLVGNHNPNAEIDMTYTPSRKASAGNAATFNGTTSIIEIPNGDELMNTHDFTLSFWIKAADAGHGHFVIGLGAFYGFQFELNGDFKQFKMPVQFEYGDGTSGTGGDLLYNGDGKTKDNGGYQGTTFNKEDASLDGKLKNVWAHIVYVYNSVTKERMIYLNSDLVIKQDHNLWPDGDKQKTVVGLKYLMAEPDVYNDLAFGFIQSRRGMLWDAEPWGGYDLPGANHFMGQLDDVRIFNKAITEAEIGLIYNSEKP